MNSRISLLLRVERSYGYQVKANETTRKGYIGALSASGCRIGVPIVDG